MNTRKNLILVVACTAVFIEALDIAIINLAIPMIQKTFGISNETAQWVQTLYVLVYGGLLILGGKLSDSLGRRKVFLTGSALFLVTSLGAGLSHRFEFLIFFRSAQGLAAALLMPSALSILTNTFTESTERGKAIGIFSSFAAIGSGCGLSLGGILATFLGWPWVFFINVPVITVAMVLGYFIIQRDQKAEGTSLPDLTSAALLTAGILIVSYLVHELARIRETVSTLLLLTAALFLLITLFIRRNRKLKDPLIRFSIFRNRSTITGNLVSIFLGAFFTGYLFIISIIMQTNLGYSAAKAGLLLFPFSILSALVSKYFLPVLFKRLSIRQTGSIGMGLMVVGAITLFFFMYAEQPTLLLFLSAACVTGSGMAITFPSLMVMSIQNIPTAHHGLATSLVATCYFIGGGLGLSVLSLFMQISNPSEKVTFIPVFVLAGYAVIGMIVLLTAGLQRNILVGVRAKFNI